MKQKINQQKQTNKPEHATKHSKRVRQKIHRTWVVTFFRIQKHVLFVGISAVHYRSSMLHAMMHRHVRIPFENFSKTYT